MKSRVFDRTLPVDFAREEWKLIAEVRPPPIFGRIWAYWKPVDQS
jgi:hypothetical protein